MKAKLNIQAFFTGAGSSHSQKLLNQAEKRAEKLTARADTSERTRSVTHIYRSPRRASSSRIKTSTMGSSRARRLLPECSTEA